MDIKNKIESFEVLPSTLRRKILLRDSSVKDSSISLSQGGKLKKKGISDDTFDYHWLRLTGFPPVNKEGGKINLVDLFCGTGPMSLGVVEGGRALGFNVNPILAIDFDKSSTLNYSYNFPDCNVITDDIGNIIDGNLGSKITIKEKKLLNNIDKVDILIGGPPCQGHSDLNNHTRRNDPKNDLIFKVIRFAELTHPDYVIIENVQGIKHDKNGVLKKAKEYLIQMGYFIKEEVLIASEFGVAQKRKRFFLIASKKEVELSFENYKREKTTSFEWACGDLIKVKSNDTFNTASKHAIINQKRIEYLFEHDLYELPNHQRPKCHQNGNHSYNSVYARMYFDKPAPTITGGFGSIGQGRFCHPKCQRSITPHEAARLQFIPDFFKFHPDLNRVALQHLIGNAVPPKLTYIITLELLR
jgi:DNA (cytosine-5)-methyltransferase 1